MVEAQYSPRPDMNVANTDYGGCPGYTWTSTATVVASLSACQAWCGTFEFCSLSSCPTCRKWSGTCATNSNGCINSVH